MPICVNILYNLYHFVYRHIFLTCTRIVNFITHTGLCPLYANIMDHNSIYTNLFRELFPSGLIAFEDNFVDQFSRVRLGNCFCMKA